MADDAPSWLREHEAARHSAALVSLDHRGRLRATGEDRASFLHNLLSNDVAGLAVREGRHALLLTGDSKLVADLRVLREETEIVLDLDRIVAVRTKQHLEKHAIADDVELEDRSESEATIGLVGPRASDVLAAIGAPAPATLFAHARGRIEDRPARIVATRWTGGPGFDLHVAREHRDAVWDALLAAGGAVGLVAASPEAFEVLRVEAGTALAQVDVDESNLALETGLDEAISFRKGCYLGQETVERIAARGHVNKKRVGLRLAGDRLPPRDAAVRRGTASVGRITSSAWSPGLHAAIAMGYVRREAFEPGTELEVETGEGAVTAVVVALPFVG